MAKAPPRRKVGGYYHRQEIIRGIRANKGAREAVRTILDEQPGMARLNFLLAEVAHHLGTELESFTELERIGKWLEKVGSIIDEMLEESRGDERMLALVEELARCLGIEMKGGEERDTEQDTDLHGLHG